MDTTKMTVVELKALAYDILVQMQNLQAQSQSVNQLIAKKVKEELEEKTKIPKK